jgi:hypothetical protein
MVTPTILFIARINQAAACWATPWLALQQSQVPHAGRIS